MKTLIFLLISCCIWLILMIQSVLKIPYYLSQEKVWNIGKLGGKAIPCLTLFCRTYTTHKYRSKYDVGKLILMDELA